MKHRFSATARRSLALAVVAGALSTSSVLAQNQTRHPRSGPPPVPTQCAQADAFCLGIAPGGSMWVPDAAGAWSALPGNDLRARASAFVTAHPSGSHAFVAYWSTEHQPNGVEATLRRAGMTSVEFLARSGN